MMNGNDAHLYLLASLIQGLVANPALVQDKYSLSGLLDEASTEVQNFLTRTTHINFPFRSEESELVAARLDEIVQLLQRKVAP